ncbi:MAG: PIG-L family deacetylase [Proteobacteria bacterium]|nr:PIG-L family deacetylase [Pseudomonadota bacterium]
MNVIIVAPHMDDEVLGCGGVIMKHKEKGDNVSVIFIAHRVYNHSYNHARNVIEKTHAQKAKEILGYDHIYFLGLPDERLDAAVQDIIIPLERQVEMTRPDIVYVPFRGDNNQDHIAVFNAARVVFRPTATTFIKKIYMYEVPSSTEQSPSLLENAYLPSYYVDIKKYIDKKLAALACYESEIRPFPHPRSPDGLRIWSQKRGMEIGFEYAEAFMILRDKWC